MDFSQRRGVIDLDASFAAGASPRFFSKPWMAALCAVVALGGFVFHPVGVASRRSCHFQTVSCTMNGGDSDGIEAAVLKKIAELREAGANDEDILGSIDALTDGLRASEQNEQIKEEVRLANLASYHTARTQCCLCL